MPENHTLIRAQVLASEQRDPLSLRRWEVILTYASGSGFERTRTFSELTFEEADKINRAWLGILHEIAQDAGGHAGRLEALF